MIVHWIKQHVQAVASAQEAFHEKLDQTLAAAEAPSPQARKQLHQDISALICNDNELTHPSVDAFVAAIDIHNHMPSSLRHIAAKFAQTATTLEAQRPQTAQHVDMAQQLRLMEKSALVASHAAGHASGSRQHHEALQQLSQIIYADGVVSREEYGTMMTFGYFSAADENVALWPLEKLLLAPIHDFGNDLVLADKTTLRANVGFTWETGDLPLAYTQADTHPQATNRSRYNCYSFAFIQQSGAIDNDVQLKRVMANQGYALVDLETSKIRAGDRVLYITPRAKRAPDFEDCRGEHALQHDTVSCTATQCDPKHLTFDDFAIEHAGIVVESERNGNQAQVLSHIGSNTYLHPIDQVAFTYGMHYAIVRKPEDTNTPAMH